MINDRGIGQRIKQLRTEANVTQAQLADDIKTKPSTFRMWELGRSEPDIESLIELSDYFGVSVDYLLGRSDSKGPKKEKYEEIENVQPQNRGRFDSLILDIKFKVRCSSENDQNSIMRLYEHFGDLLDEIFKHGMPPVVFGSDDLSMLIGSIDEKWLTPIRSRLVQIIIDKYSNIK